MFIFVPVFAAFQSEPLYVPVKFHDLPSEKPENTNIDTEKCKQNLEFHNLEVGGSFSFIQAIPKLSGSVGCLGSPGSSSVPCGVGSACSCPVDWIFLLIQWK